MKIVANRQLRIRTCIVVCELCPWPISAARIQYPLGQPSRFQKVIKLKKVLFVCMGNICRSPAGEGVLQSILARENLQDEIFVDSAGTIGYHAGKPADARMRQAAERRGYNLTSRARQVNRDDCETFHLIVAMDRDNLRYCHQLAPDHKGKMKLLSEFLVGDWPEEVPDPYYGGDAGFEKVLDMIEAACPRIILELQNGGASGDA